MDIVLVEASRVGLSIMSRIFTDRGHTCHCFTDGAEALQYLVEHESVDLLVTSFELSKGGKQAKEANAKKGGLSRDVDLGGLIGGVKKTEIAAFTRQMSTLLKSGIPLAEALGALVEQQANLRFKTSLSEVRTNVNEGMSLDRKSTRLNSSHSSVSRMPSSA